MNNTTIIIVTFNAMPWIDRCLKSCGNYPVIVVDNASTDTTIAHIQATYPNVIILPQTKNLGFGQGNNVGIAYALKQGAEHFFLLNQDAYLVDYVLNQLIVYQIAHPKYGILSPIHITADRAKLDKNFMNYMLREQTGRFYSDFVLGSNKADVYEVPFVNAAAWLLSRECIDTVGGFDPLFFHYGEDDNFCQRVLYHGYKIGVLPDVYVIHDRESRIKLKNANIQQILMNKEMGFKLKWADINKESHNDIALCLKKLKIKILKSILKLKITTAKILMQEFKLIIRIEPEILKSRSVNLKKGRHYLINE